MTEPIIIIAIEHGLVSGCTLDGVPIDALVQDYGTDDTPADCLMKDDGNGQYERYYVNIVHSRKWWKYGGTA